MMDHVQTLLMIAVLQTVAVISPGPDFAVVSRNSILYSRRIGIISALGITAGVFFHLGYLTIGLGFTHAYMDQAMSWIQLGGSVYLAYLGIKSILSTLKSSRNSNPLGNRASGHISEKKIFLTSFFTNALNPKAILFLLSLFTVVLDKNTPFKILALAGLIVVLITLIWFLFVAVCFSGKFRKYFLKYARLIDGLVGILLLWVSVRILSSVKLS